MKQFVQDRRLDGGIRLVTEAIPGARSVSVGVWIATGARHEERGESGLSHFTEHLLFKGTKRRTAREIALALEAVGGYLDAFTGREHTCYYARVLPEHMPRAVAVLADMLRNTLFRRDRIDREKGVVLEEIKTYEDTPDELIHDLFASEVWRGHPLGNPILGSARSVRAFQPAVVRRFYQRRYTPDRVLVAVAGALRADSVRRLVERRLVPAFAAAAAGGKGDGRGEEPAALAEGGALLGPARAAGMASVRVVKRALSQEYLCIGGEAPPFASPDRLPLVLLATILGGGMSSRLFQSIRERRGLAYSVYSYTDSYVDSGLFATYAATVPARAPVVLDLILREYRRLHQNGVSARELRDAKSQLRGEIVFSLESVGSRMRMLATPALYGQEHRPIDFVLRRIDRVTREDVARVARRFLDPERQMLVGMGPVARRMLAAEIP
jgi:predicted Zn-dependent peptidase